MPLVRQLQGSVQTASAITTLQLAIPVADFGVGVASLTTAPLRVEGLPYVNIHVQFDAGTAAAIDVVAQGSIAMEGDFGTPTDLNWFQIDPTTVLPVGSFIRLDLRVPCTFCQGSTQQRCRRHFFRIRSDIRRGLKWLRKRKLRKKRDCHNPLPNPL